MTLAPERPTVVAPTTHPPISPTEPHHIGTRIRDIAHHTASSRLSVGETTAHHPQPALKASGRPNPLAQLTPVEVEELGRELDAIRSGVMDSRGAADAAYIRRVIAVQRWLELGSRGALLFSGVKVKGVRPAWWLGTAGLALAKILENMEIGHNVLHGQWDWMRDPKIHSTTWEWDFVSPSAQWQKTHNETHHTYTNVVGMDNDLGYGIMRVDVEQPWELRHLVQPVLHIANAFIFEYGIAAYDLEIRGYLMNRKHLPEDVKVEFRKEANKTLAKMRRQATKDYLAHPLLALPLGGARHTLTANITANVIRNVWANTVIICGHFPKGIQTFETDSIEGETRGEWYMRQMLGSGNISGSRLLHILTGNLSHQIEHHLFPDMPSNRYAEVAPKVRALMERHDLRYVTGPILKQAAEVYWKVFELALPDKQPGVRRRDVVAAEVKRAWRARKGKKAAAAATA